MIVGKAAAELKGLPGQPFSSLARTVDEGLADAGRDVFVGVQLRHVLQVTGMLAIHGGNERAEPVPPDQRSEGRGRAVANCDALVATVDAMARRLDPYSLQLFVTAAQEGSIARAAAKENIAASALSRRIADLEHTFGVPLLVRSAHGISLTEAGRAAFERARQFEVGLEALLRDVQSLGGIVSGKVRLFANASSVIGFLPERLKRFTAAYPLVSIELQERLSSEIVRACLDDVADLGICAVADVPNGLDAWHFARDPLMVVMPVGHALADVSPLHFRQVVEHPLVCVQSGGALDRLLRERAAMAGLEIKVTVSVSSFDGVCRMVEAGLGIAVVTQSAAAAYAGASQFVRRPLGESWVQRDLLMIALHKAPRAAAVQALIDTLKG